MQRRIVITAVLPALGLVGVATAQPAPRLPTPPVATNAPPPVYLQQARRSIQAGRTGEAMEALERAETRILEVIGAPPRPGGPATNPFITGIHNARAALARGDRREADRIVADLIAHTRMAPSG